MRSVSLSTRLFLSLFLVSAMLFGGSFFYLRGYHSRMEEQRAAAAFERALTHHLQHPGDPGRLAALTGIQTLWLGASTALEADPGASLLLSPADLQALAALPFDSVMRASLSRGNYLVKSPSASSGQGRRLVLLFPLRDFENAVRDLVEAFLVAGLVLLLLITVFSQLLAQEIARPLAILRDRVRAIGSQIGLEPPEDGGDEIQVIAKSYLDVANQLQLELDYRKLALDELESTKGELLRSNSRLRSRLFQVKVLLSLWNEQEKAEDVKQFLTRFLEVLLPGLPFQYGCVIIRPLAEMESEVVFARVDRQAGSEERFLEEETDPGLARDRTQWTGIIDPRVKEFLLRESEACMASSKVLVGSISASVSRDTPETQLYVMSVRLKRGEEPLGSLHFLSEHEAPPLGEQFFGFLANLSNQVAAQLQIHALTYATRLDPLTRLYNRGYLHDRLREEAIRAARAKGSFSLLMLDIDHFAALNGAHGRQTGDEVLRGLATLLKGTCRGSDAVCRYSATELAVILTDTPLSGARIFAENFRKSVEAQVFPTPGGEARITVSMGVAEYPAHGKSVSELIERCQQGLREAKAAGRNGWRVAA